MSPVFVPRPGRRQTPGPEQKRHRGEDTVRSKETQRTLNDNKHVRASSTEDHAAPNPRSRDRAAGQKDQPEPPGEKQKMRPTRGSSMQPALKNSRPMTPYRPVPPTEKQVYTLASTPPSTYIRTVPKPSWTTRRKTKSNFSTSSGVRKKAAAALQTNERERPGRRQP